MLDWCPRSPYDVNQTKRTSLNIKAIYNYSRHWEFTGGHSFEKYTYSDIGYSNTRYVTTTGNTAGLVTGQFSFQPYTADIFYATAKYKF